MTAPTLVEAGGQYSIAGTSFHQHVLAEIAAQVSKEQGDAGVDVVGVELEVVTQGQYAGAVRVQVGGQLVGSIPTGRSAAYRPLLEDLACQGRGATCRAVLVGGHEREEGGQANFGLALLQPTKPALAAPGAPFLPPAVGARVEANPAVLEQLDAVIPSRAKRFTHRLVGTLDPREWTLRLDGQTAGALVHHDHAAGLQLMLTAYAAGFPLTCHVRLVREPARPLRIAVDLPM